MHNSSSSEFWRVVVLLACGLVLGLFSGQVAIALALVLLLYVGINLHHFKHLIGWLNDPESREIPVNFGMWGDVYAKVQRLCAGHRRREHELELALAQYQASAAALPDAAVVLGPGGQIRWFNEAATRLLRLRAPQDQGRRLVNLFRAPQLAGYFELGDFSAPLEITAPGDKSRRLAIRVTDYGSGERLVVAQDVTERVMAEQIRKDFVANVSHELRTPLTVISGFVENMQFDDGNIPPQWRKPVELIAGQAERMQHIVEDLLLLARLESASVEAPYERIDIAALLDAITREGRSVAGDRLGIEVEIESHADLFGDPGQIRSVFTNLMFNAIQYTPDDGQVVLRWLDGLAGSVFVVEDTGEGIAAEHIPRLTERFYRVDVGRSRERGGTGLGLAIVKHVLQKHGAKLEIESTVGEGSRFSCHFPASRRPDSLQ